MKIICIGRNYVDHIKELSNAVPEKPVVFLKPSTALLKDGKAFYYPDFSKDIHYECELIFKICKSGKSIQKQHASSYFDEISLGIDFTARDLQQECKQKGLPWEIAKAFDHSAVVGNFIPKSNLDPSNIRFQFLKNEEIVQEGASQMMMYNIEDIIVYCSQFFRLDKGDIIFTGTPAGVGPIKIGDKYIGILEGNKLLQCEIK